MKWLGVAAAFVATAKYTALRNVSKNRGMVRRNTWSQPRKTIAEHCDEVDR